VIDKDTVLGNCCSLLDDHNITKNNYLGKNVKAKEKLFAIFSIHGLYNDDHY